MSWRGRVRAVLVARHAFLGVLDLAAVLFFLTFAADTAGRPANAAAYYAAMPAYIALAAVGLAGTLACYAAQIALRHWPWAACTYDAALGVLAAPRGRPLRTARTLTMWAAAALSVAAGACLLAGELVGAAASLGLLLPCAAAQLAVKFLYEDAVLRVVADGRAAADGPPLVQNASESLS